MAQAFSKFNEYSLAKYNRDNTVKLRDVLFLCHAKPKDAEQEAVWKRLVDGTLATPDTWEVELSKGGDKKAGWERLLRENKLGALALLRNLRNMTEAGLETGVLREALGNIKAERVLPFRFIAAARYAPKLEPELGDAMLKCVADQEKLRGRTVLLVDVSGSMDAPISAKSDLQRIDAACGVAMLAREVCEDVDVLTFSTGVKEVPARRAFALRDAIAGSQPHSSTNLGDAMRYVNGLRCDRVIVFTDEQSHQAVPNPVAPLAYMVNVASFQSGVGYQSGWRHIDGFSEAIIDYVRENERAQ